MIRRNAAGFSLIEILIALVIGALLVSFSVQVFGDKRKDELEKQSQRLYALLRQAQDESLLRSLDIGIRIDEEFYQFYLYDGEEWLPLEGDKFFVKREFPEFLEVKLVVDGNTLFGEDDEDNVDIFEEEVDIFEGDEPKIEPPQIYILSSGEMNDFKVALGWTDDEPTYYLISGTMIGDMDIEGPLSGDLRIEVNDDALFSE
ncbi:Tfp pilus assembly protein FimT/FimU [Pleionea sp. CnH1-48]|uniref:pilus assembly FimT family protein n=1 Tax=Pleionea sp. CnH1-48 TaxID=2954494 RepID=UPI002097551D|nr:prepilin-type N-terminal cleavage/methylation domain-containing protein [Pleionea sp. CnH1-48]MCO7225200.1 prepilin-type N-terminal cleavage/methylation domain-containing protein [Pleionea sp. CnH1-48]